jgi:rSAM/selenodomain-associated transferase 1
MYRGQRVGLIIPALNEAETIASVIAEVDREIVDHIVVADNGSSDETTARAAAAGALVVHEPRRGYGSACLKAIREGPAADILVFMDGDGSDDATEIESLLAALVQRGADLAIGSRVLGQAEAGTLTAVQVFGNALTCKLVRLFWKVHYTDLGPFRAIRRRSLEKLAMADPDFGWTIEMQVKAAQRRLRVVEIPVRCRPRQGGHSKVSGTFRGSVGAGQRILGYVLRAKAKELFRGRGTVNRRLIVFTRYPEPGRAKTRLIPVLGTSGATHLHKRLAEHAIAQARSVADQGVASVEIHFDGGEKDSMRRWLGSTHTFRRQEGPDLGTRMARAFQEAFTAGVEATVIMGTDCPDLGTGTLIRAFAELDHCDLILGPALDGGYYLIGLRRPAAELFGEIDWSTDQVLAQTLDRATKMGLQIVQLEKLQDIDRPEDLERASLFLGEKT